MAYLFPNTPPTLLPPEVLQVFRFLKTLPENWVVWHHLAPWQKDTPDFLILNADQQAVLVKVSNARACDAHSAAQLLLLADDHPPLGEAEGRLLLDYHQMLHDATPLQGVVMNTTGERFSKCFPGFIFILFRSRKRTDSTGQLADGTYRDSGRRQEAARSPQRIP